MAQRVKKIKFEVFSVHIHEKETAADYPKLFTAMAKIPAPKRYSQLDTTHIAIPILEEKSNVIWFVACEGEEGAATKIYNMDSSDNRVVKPKPREMFSTDTYGVIDLLTKEAIIQYNQKGAKAENIAEVFGKLAGHATGNDHSVVLVPVADKSFFEAIQSMDRVRVATIKVAKPNDNWQDEYNALTELGDESNGKFIEVGVYAERDKGLSKTGGILGILKGMLAGARSSVKSASVKGKLTPTSAETTIPLQKHIEHKRESVICVDGIPDDMEMKRTLTSYLTERRKVHAAALKARK
jgi:hypothetical protein